MGCREVRKPHLQSIKLFLLHPLSLNDWYHGILPVLNLFQSRCSGSIPQFLVIISVSLCALCGKITIQRTQLSYQRNALFPDPHPITDKLFA
jgi:hypothetical protein